jgi:hypothetical protein
MMAYRYGLIVQFSKLRTQQNRLISPFGPSVWSFLILMIPAGVKSVYNYPGIICGNYAEKGKSIDMILQTRLISHQYL